MKIELKKKGKKIDVGGVVYQLRKPNVGDQRLFAKIKNMDEVEVVDEMISWLDSMGLPKEIAEQIAVEDLKPLFEEIFKEEEKKS